MGAEYGRAETPIRWGRWTALALAVFGLSLATAFEGFWGHDLRVTAPVALGPSGADPEAPLTPVGLADYRFCVWAVSRNARALFTTPASLFDAEPCHPALNTLALSHPVLTPALLAAPVQALLDEPVLSFNIAFFGGLMIAALAMYLLVADWTGVPAAGVAAGVLYAFHRSQIGVPYHFFTVDNEWTLLGLLFARRVFEHARWRDAAALGACCALQMASSFYAFLGSALLALPMAVWLAWHHRMRRAALGPLVLSMAMAAAAAACVFWPYLTLDIPFTSARTRFFAPWSRFLPGEALFPGWLGLALLLAGLAPRRLIYPAGREGDPRIALGVAALLAALFATGGNVRAQMAPLYGGDPPVVVLPNLLRLLAQVLPGIDVVRVPSLLAAATVQVLCLFAGFGAAALLRQAPHRWLPLAAAALIAAVFVAARRPAFLGLRPPVSFVALRLRPEAAKLAFHRELQARTGSGPLLELPMDRSRRAYTFFDATEQHLLTAYHRRRSSGCYASRIPLVVRRLDELSEDIHRPGALDRIAALGFTTLVVHHPAGDREAQRYARRVRHAAARSGGRLRPVLETPERTGYALRSGGAPPAAAD